MSATLQLPNQLLPDSKKNEAWIMENLRAIKGIATHDSLAKRKDIESWYMYHNIWNEREFEYLTKIPSGNDGTADYYLPARVRHIPIQRAKLNVLISQQKYRPFAFSVRVGDEDGRAEKYVRRIHDYIKGVMDEIQNRVSEYTLQLQNIAEKQQELEQYLAKQPETQEELVQQQQLQQMKKVVDAQFKKAQVALQRELLMDEKDLKKMERYYKYEKEDWIEDIAQKAAYRFRQDYEVENVSLKNFISQIVTGKQAYIVDYEPGDSRMTFESQNMLEVYYPIIEGIQWIQQLPWVLVRRYVSLNYATEKYNLKYDDIQKLKNQIYTNIPITDFMNNDFGNNLSGVVYSGTLGNSEGIPEYRIWWRSPKLVQAKKNPNPHKKGQYFTHFIDDEEKIINKGNIVFDNIKKKWIDKETGQDYNKEDIIHETKGEKLEKRYIDEIWQGVILGEDVIVNAGKKPIRLTTNDDYSNTLIPVIGRAYNSITDRPYSLVWDTKDLQKGYNVLNYHRDLMLAVSGVRGTIMDITQKPDGMTKEEWMYFKKLGTQWIESVKKSGRQSSFNQFGQYDDSVSPSIQYIDNMMIMTDEMLGNIIGVGRQRQGQVAPSDQVATFQTAIQQNSLITEVIYADHDEVERRALEVAFNIACKYLYKDGITFDYDTDGLSHDVVKIPKDLLNKYDFHIKVKNNNLEEQKLKEIKQFAMTEFSKGQMAFRDMLKLYNTETLVSLEKKFEQIADDAAELARENMNAQSEAETSGKERLVKLQGDIDMAIKSSESKLKEMELQFKQQVEAAKAQLMGGQLQVQQKKVDNDYNAKLIDIETERQIESRYIDEQTRSNSMDERLRAIELQMKALLEESKGRTTSGKGSSMAGKAKERIKD